MLIDLDNTDQDWRYVGGGDLFVRCGELIHRDGGYNGWFLAVEFPIQTPGEPASDYCRLLIDPHAALALMQMLEVNLQEVTMSRVAALLRRPTEDLAEVEIVVTDDEFDDSDVELLRSLRDELTSRLESFDRHPSNGE